MDIEWTTWNGLTHVNGGTDLFTVLLSSVPSQFRRVSVRIKDDLRKRTYTVTYPGVIYPLSWILT